MENANQTRRYCLLCLVVISAGIISGCAFVDRQVDLQYQTEQKPSGEVIAKITILRFADERPEPNRLGDVLNGWGMKTASIRATADKSVADWVTSALIDELHVVGIQATLQNSQPDSGTVLSGQVTEVVCNMIFSYEATLMLKIKVVRDGQVIFTETYHQKGSGGVVVIASSAGCAEAMNNSLRLLLKKAVPELKQAITAP